MSARDTEWTLKPNAAGYYSWEAINVALLMDLREQLRLLNVKLAGVGPTVHDIERNTRAGRQCSKCGAGPYETTRGLRQHYRKGHG